MVDRGVPRQRQGRAGPRDPLQQSHLPPAPEFRVARNAVYVPYRLLESKTGVSWLRSSPCAAFTKPPFRISEEGWGEFDMQIEFTADKAHFIAHDLHFREERYESKHVLVSWFWTGVYGIYLD